jgi:hypothetical protein
MMKLAILYIIIVEILKISQTTKAKYVPIFCTDTEYKIPRMLCIFHLSHEWWYEVN